MYNQKTIGGRTVTPQEAYTKATVTQRMAWFPEGPPAAGYGPGPAGVDVDGASLSAAVAAGQAAMAAGYGQARADGLIPCTECTKCNQQA